MPLEQAIAYAVQVDEEHTDRVRKPGNDDNAVCAWEGGEWGHPR